MIGRRAKPPGFGAATHHIGSKGALGAWRLPLMDFSRPTRPPAPAEFWAAPLAGQSPTGLDAAEAARRLASDGPNHVADGHRLGVVAKVARRLVEPLVAILLVAALVSGLTGDLASLAIILVMVVFSIALDVSQEHRAENAAEALKRSVAIRCQARRGGAVVEVAVDDIVAGDVVLLAAGDLVPADGVALEARDLMVNEALLTGEPYPVAKRPGDAAGQARALFGGTAVVSGTGAMLVLATGGRTRLGGIAAALDAREPPTAFERGVHGLGVLILRLTVFLVLFVLLAHLAFHRPALESFMFAVALAVGLTPELLPMVMTVTLARGAMRMAARRVVVKRLAAIHDLGAMDVLCTDKTGTLTEARIALIGHPDAAGVDAPGVLALAAVNARLATGVHSPMDDAILGHPQTPAIDAWRRIDDLPFDFERRRVSVLADDGQRRMIITKGAIEEVVKLCPAADAKALLASAEARAAEGLRVLGLAWRDAAGQEHLAPEDERDLTFLGFLVFIDPPKESAGPAITRLSGLGVRVKIISGDAAPVVAHLVATLKIPAQGLATGAEIAALDDAALQVKVRAVDCFARVSPEQKMRIIRALQAGGATVGFMGDGINDAPAIKAADVGLSVEGATDVARAAADMILLAPDLNVLADGVREGRRTYANITKYVRMGTSSNFGNMLSMALASLVIPFLPLTAIQILLNNLLYDLSETGIPFDRVDEADVAAPHGWDMGAVLRFTGVMGPLSSLFDIATFSLLLWAAVEPEVFRTAWFVESIATQVLVIFLIRTGGKPWASMPHPILAATSLGALALALFLALGPFAAVFGFGLLPGWMLGAIAALVLGYLVCAQLLKPLAMRHGVRR